MRAFFRQPGGAPVGEHPLERPLAGTIGCVADHLGTRARGTFDRIAKLDRERTPGEHVFDRGELLELCAAAHALLVDPPAAVRRQRRVMEGPLPGADPIGALASWLGTCAEAVVIYDLWRSTAAPTGD